MTKTLLHVIVDVLEHAKRRARSTPHDGEKLWLATHVIEPLQDVLACVRSEEGPAEHVRNALQGIRYMFGSGEPMLRSDLPSMIFLVADLARVQARLEAAVELLACTSKPIPFPTPTNPVARRSL
jgi:hypothetical protein